MKMKMIVLPLMLSLASAPVLAGHGHGHHKKRGHSPQSEVVKAPVTHVEPLVEVVQVPIQRQECWDEVVSGSTTRQSNGGMLAGAIIGGVVGHNIGKGRHRDVSRAAGAIIGAAIGHDSDRSYQQPYSYTEQHCAVHTDYLEEERIHGYRVSYRYQGELYTTRMDRDPGRFVQLRVSHQLLD